MWQWTFLILKIWLKNWADNNSLLTFKRHSQFKYENFKIQNMFQIFITILEQKSAFLGQITPCNQAYTTSPRQRVWDCKIPKAQDVSQYDFWKGNMVFKNHWLPQLLFKIRPCCQGIIVWTFEFFPWCMALIAWHFLYIILWIFLSYVNGV